MGTTNETRFRIHSQNYHSMKIGEVASPGLTAGEMFLEGETICVAPESYETGAEGVGIYKCEKISLPKVAGTGKTIVAGNPVYYDTATGEVVSAANKSTADLVCGICLEDAAADDIYVKCEFDGTIEALN